MTDVEVHAAWIESETDGAEPSGLTWAFRFHRPLAGITSLIHVVPY